MRFGPLTLYNTIGVPKENEELGIRNEELGIGSKGDFFEEYVLFFLFFYYLCGDFWVVMY